MQQLDELCEKFLTSCRTERAKGSNLGMGFSGQLAILSNLTA